MAIMPLLDGTSIASLLLFLSQSLHVSNPVVLLCFQTNTVDLTTAILTNDFQHVRSKWMVINNCASPTALSTISQLKQIPFIISVVDTNGNETVAQISAMHDACPKIAQTTHLVILDDPDAKEHASETLFAEFAEKFLLLHILSWHSDLKLLTKRTWFKDDIFIRSDVIVHDDEHRRWSTDLADFIPPYRNVNYVLLCVPPFLIKTKGVVDGRVVTSVGGMEVDTVSLVAAQMQVLPRFFAVDFTTTTSTEQCYDCVIRDEYYEHTYFVRNMRSQAIAIEQIVKTSKGRGFQEFQ